MNCHHTKSIGNNLYLYLYYDDDDYAVCIHNFSFYDFYFEILKQI